MVQDSGVVTPVGLVQRTRRLTGTLLWPVLSLQTKAAFFSYQPLAELQGRLPPLQARGGGGRLNHPEQYRSINHSLWLCMSVPENYFKPARGPVGAPIQSASKRHLGWFPVQSSSLQKRWWVQSASRGDRVVLAVPAVLTAWHLEGVGGAVGHEVWN